tara:strand:+ start:694 stop:1266 length:573 start_codon:yes stop_codon:yes gene_type:complete
MARRPLYVPKSDVGPAEYTAGEEFMDKEGKEYIGLYHKLKNGQIWSEASFNSKSKQLQLYVATIAGGEPSNGRYFELTGKIFNKHTVPVYHYPMPTKKDYEKANFVRFFVAKKNDHSTIIEIDFDQFRKLNTANQVGLNDDVYTQLELKWTISGPMEDVIKYNKASLLQAARIIPTIKDYLGDLTEYYRG